MMGMDFAAPTPPACVVTEGEVMQCLIQAPKPFVGDGLNEKAIAITALIHRAGGRVVKWKRVGDQYPPKHRRYAVIRGEKVFTCTVCYGMHNPWWIVHLMDGTEAGPVPMQDDDRWTDAILSAIMGAPAP